MLRDDDQSKQIDATTRFAVLWDALADLVGSSATATLVRRAAKHASPRCPSLAGLIIEKPGLDYEYRTPPSWSDADAEATAIRVLLHALAPLLVELTGDIVIQRLRAIAELAPLFQPENT